MKRSDRALAYLAVAGVIGLAAGIPLGALLFGGSDSQDRRAGALGLLEPAILTAGCDRIQRTAPFGTGTITLIFTDVGSRFRSSSNDLVPQARFTFYRDGVANVGPWVAGDWRYWDQSWAAGRTHIADTADPNPPTTARVEWRLGKDAFVRTMPCVTTAA